MKEERDVFDFLGELKRVFSGEAGVWDCSFCYWLDTDERICNICQELRDIVELEVGRDGEGGVGGDL